MRAVSFSRFVPVSLVLLCLTLAAGLAQAAEPGSAQQPLTADEQSFLARAMSDNAAQIALAKMALAKSSNPRVIELANTIIQERSALDMRMAPLIDRNAHAQLDQQQAAASDDAVSHVQHLNGDMFDKTFASTAVRSHCRLISAYEAMKLTASSQALKDLAHQAIPALRGDLTVAMAVLRSSGPATPRHHEALASADGRGGSKAAVFWEPISLVAAPW
jgi:predicted outer membrane protein